MWSLRNGCAPAVKVEEYDVAPSFDYSRVCLYPSLKLISEEHLASRSIWNPARDCAKIWVDGVSDSCLGSVSAHLLVLIKNILGIVWLCKDYDAWGVSTIIFS